MNAQSTDQQGDGQGDMSDVVQGARMPGAVRRLLTAAALLALFAVPATEAEAQSRVCRQIESQLASLSNGGGAGSGQSRRYDQAIEKQRAQIQKAQRQLRRAGCGGGFFSRDTGGSACNAIESGIDRMERNLLSLQRKRGQMGGGDGNPRRQRARLMASLDANGCRKVARGNREVEEVSASREGRGNIFQQLFGGGIKRSETFEDFDGTARVRTVIGGDGGSISHHGGGSYRTLCVRTCDGYYWPISYSSSRGDFDRDEQNCQTMCPGTEVKLFSHRVPDEESENMVDGYGSAYTDLTTAFKYRDVNFTRPEGCGCNPTKNFSIIAGGGQPMSQLLPPEPELIPTPVTRPDPAADPETLANRDGRLDAEALKRLSATRPVAAGETGEKKVRVVGPAYLPDPEGAIDLRAPAPTAIQ
jgi:hypothetical protein